MLSETLTAIVGASPPQPLVPSPGEAFLGWVMGLAVLVGPMALVLASWKRRHGRWWYAFTQWNTGAFLMLVIGSIVAAIGMFGMIGVVPAWQAAWNNWYFGIVTSNSTADMTALNWLQSLQGQYAFALQVTAGVIFLLGATGVVVGQSRLARKMAQYRHEGPDDWLIATPESEATGAPQGERRLTHPLSS